MVVPLSTAHVTIFGSGQVLPINVQTVDYTPTAQDYTVLVNATSASRTVTLVPAVNLPGKIFAIKRIDSTMNTVTVAAAAGDTIDGSATKTLSSLGSIVIQSDSENTWHIIAAA